MSEDEHLDSEFYYLDELESHKENSEAITLSGYEQLYENSREEIESFLKEQKREYKTRKAFNYMKTFQRYLSSVNKENVEILDLPAGDLDHLLAKFGCCSLRKSMIFSLPCCNTTIKVFL